MIPFSTMDIFNNNNWFAPILIQYLEFRELRSLSVTCKNSQAAISSAINSWPREIRELLRTYITETPSFFLIPGVRMKDAAQNYVEPYPIIQLQLDTLWYDGETKKLIGHPWSSHISGNNTRPRTIIGPNVTNVNACFADDDCTEVFVCGGFQLHSGPSKMTALLSTKLGTWTELPLMPEPRYDGGIFRVASRIYVLGKEGGKGKHADPSITTLCFDRDLDQWVDSGIDVFPGNACEEFATVALNDNTVIVAGGTRSFRQVFALDIPTGVWTRMPDLPNVFGTDYIAGYCVSTDEHPHGLAVFIGQKSWVTLVGGEWVVNPDLRGSGLKALRVGYSRSKLFVGNGFIDLPAQEKVDNIRMELLFRDHTNRLVLG